MISVLRDIIVEILLCKKDTIYIAGENRNIDMVKAIFKKITSSHIDNVITTCAEVFKDGTNTVTNPKNYLTASLYNSVAMVHLPTSIHNIFKLHIALII